ncbi:polysaccharide deacetylase family protein [Flavobacterium sp. N1994]|uniref:polysaccharide deacetylase family protein n=1 Tax=Flavobacterium sp. N1994 TaxID=2986827 RepID=UPI002223DC6E|nr:polysaccharide deacetylase family protein [Flavobacterium sp. N1994]
MVLLSFDIEEFDLPLEYNKSIDFIDQISISVEGTTAILNILKKHHVKATFFSTATFAIHAPEIIKRIIDEGHEIASHNYYHSDFKVEHLKLSREKLEELTGQEVHGFRMPRMQPVDEIEIFNAGYQYNSSLNPTYIPGRYNNFKKPRTFFKEKGVLQIPASVSPIIRFPLFWLSFHNLPLSIYEFLCKQTLKKDGYLNLYFHPWEFTNLNQPERFNFPGYVSKNSGVSMIHRMDLFIEWLKKENYSFVTFKEFISEMK